MLDPMSRRWEGELTESLEKVFPAFYPHPSVRRIWVYHGMIYFDAFSIRLLVPGEVFQPLPGACPREASNNDIIHARDVPCWNVRHCDALFWARDGEIKSNFYHDMRL
jgi:hypothetical protein